MTLTIDELKAYAETQGFTRTRVDRMVHKTGFRDGVELRSLHLGSNPDLTNQLQGLIRPIAVEMGYGGKTIRVKVFRGTRMVKMWDLHTDRFDTEHRDRFQVEFDETVDRLLDLDHEAQARWMAKNR